MSLAEIAASVARRSSDDVVDDVVDIITFIEAPWGLDLRLYPVQRVILKAHYGLALDDNEKGFPLDVPVPEDHPEYDPELVDEDGFYKYRIVVTDWRRQNPQYMTEAGYLEHLYNEGRCNIKEVIPGVQRRDMVLSVGRRSGKCVVGDTMVLTDRGVIPIRDLGDPEGPEIQPLNVGVAQEGSKKRARSSHFYNGGVKPTFRVKTYCGYSIEGTANHRVKVMGPEGVIRWAYLDEIGEGDQIAIHRGTDLWAEGRVDATPFHNDMGKKNLGFPDEITPEWGYLLGVLVGDGCWTLKNRVEATVGDAEYREKVESVFASLLGDVKYKPDLRREATGQVQSNSHGWRKFLHDLGWSTDCGPRDKAVPWAILQSPKEVVTSFLRGLFDADGGVESGGKVVSFCSASEWLAHQVQILLLNLGVVSRVRAKWNEEYQRDYYVLTVRGLRSRQAFADHVGFTLSHKRGPLLSSLEKASREGGNTESIPHLRPWASRLLQTVPRKAKGEGWGRSHLRAALGNTIKPSASDEMTGLRLEKSLRVALDLGADPDVVQHLQGILDADYFYDPVVSVEESEARVYDLTVPEGHMFVANGMTNHNTLITSCIVAYESYKLLLKGNPQKYYGFSQSNVIQLISVATDKDQAGLLYQEAAGHFQRCDFFKPYAANSTQSFATFQTPHDIDKYGSYQDNPKARYSVKVTFRSCVAKGLRGGNNVLVALDEAAHFGDKGQASADEVYQAVSPSAKTFLPKDPNNKARPIGENEGRIILISSPLGKQGLFYKQFRLGFTSGAGANILSIQAPTWEVNPTIDGPTFEGEYLKDPTAFFTEFGAEFTDRTRGWIEDADDLIACIDPDLRPKAMAPPRAPHFMGLDVALAGDYTAIAVGHNEPDGRVVLDYIDRICAGEGDYIDQERLEFDDVADWVRDVSKRFYIHEGIFDQWAGIPMEQALAKRGLGKQMKSVHHTRQLSSQMYQNFKNMMLDKKIVLYDFPIPDDQEHSAHIAELLELQAEVISKYIIKVEAPKMNGKHDDFADALVRMVWVATQNSGRVHSVRGVRSRRGYGLASASTTRFARKPHRTRSGSHPSRMTKTKIRR